MLLEKPFAVPFASALRHALAAGDLPASWEGYRQQLVVRRAAQGDGNREFARILQLCLTAPVAQVSAALELAATSGHYSADAVRHLLDWAEADGATSAPQSPQSPQSPLDPATYPQYQLPQPRPDLAAYNHLLTVPVGGGGEGQP